MKKLLIFLALATSLHAQTKVNLQTQVSGTLPVANGGTGTATPGIVPGTNVTVSGAWPNQTVNSTGGGGSGNTTSTSLTTNKLPKANGANSIIDSLLTDDGTTATYTGTGGLSAKSVSITGGGSSAGWAGFAAGTAPSLVSGAVVQAGPSSTSGYVIHYPSALPTTNQVQQCTAASTDVTCAWATVGGTGTVTSVAQTVPAWLTVSGSPVTTTGTLAITAATGQTSHQVLGTCGTATSFSPCALVAGDIPASLSSTTSVNGTSIPSSVTLGQTVANGTAALGTTAIASGACATAVTATATGAATTDVIGWGFNADPTAITGYSPTSNGMLTIITYPTANTANFKVCNNTASSITPGAVTLNWRVAR